MAGRGSQVLLGALIVLLTGASSCAVPAFGDRRAEPTPSDTPVSVENRLPGSDGWNAAAHGAGISGYVVPASVNVGAKVGFAVSTTSPTYGIDVYRIGWYGGRGGRLVYSEQGLPGRDQGTWIPQTFGVRNCRTCVYDSATGLLEPRWTVTRSVMVPSSWPSGDYVVRLATPNGDNAYAHLVVRDDRRSSRILAVLPTNTYQAYNDWGGKSIYPSNSVGPPTVENGPFAGAATEVSLQRPYSFAVFGGAIHEDFETVSFLEQGGYDVTYATSVDLDRDPRLLDRHRIVIAVGHDEYWSHDMRDRAEAARDTGTNLIFLGGNDIFWQVRYRAGTDGDDRAVMICYRSAAIDPVAQTNPAQATVRWADPPVSRPASTLTGTVYRDPILRSPTAWVVAATAPAWLLRGTSLTTGRSISALVGYECYAFEPTLPVPPSLVIVADSPVVKADGSASHCDSVYYRGSRGSQVFSAGTWTWEDFLTGRGRNDDVVTMTNNLLARFGAGRHAAAA